MPPTGGLEIILVITVRGICWPGIQSAQPAKANGASGIALLVPDHKPLAGTAAVDTGTAVRPWYSSVTYSRSRRSRVAMAAS